MKSPVVDGWLRADVEPELTPAGKRLLDAASQLFYEHGIRGVGVDAVAGAAGTTKKTLYDIFGSKDQLVALYLHRRALRWRAHLRSCLGKRESGSLERVLAVFDAYAQWSEGSVRGCAFVNAHAEIDVPSHPALDVIRADKDWMARLFQELVAQYGESPADDTAVALHLLFEGAIVLLSVGRQSSALAQAKASATKLLEAAD
jgi:AcrR family transcriptional regulator